MLVRLVVTLYLIADTCNGVIDYLNDSEYERMPPLFEMDAKYRNCLTQAGGVFCVARFELHGDPRNDLIRTIREYSQNEIKHYNHSLIDRAICVTQTCKKFIQNKTISKVSDLNTALEGCVNETVWNEYGLEAKLALVISCDKHEDQVGSDIAEWILAGILISVLAMNIIGSVYDIWYVKNCNEKTNRTVNPYVLSFSVFRSWDELTNTNIDPRYERLNGLHGLKSISMFFVVAGHVMWVIGTGFTDNPHDFEMSHRYLPYKIMFSGMVIVEIFFVISSCLLTFHLQMLSETQTLSWKDLPKKLLYRWARLTPAYAVMLLFTATWLPRLGSGPLWSVFVGGVAADCRQYWWTHLLYFNNYVPEDRFCAVQTWHLATEMQLFTLGLVVYLATARAPRARLLTLGALAMAGLVAPALHVWWHDLDALVIHKPEFYRTFDNDTFRYMHVLGHNNVFCHALGMAVGLYSYHCIKNKIEYRNTKILKYITWSVPLCIVGLFLSGSMFYVDGERPHIALRMAYAAVHRPAMGVMTAILVLNFVLKFEDGIRSVLEWRGWMVTTRLCYGVFLLHVNIIHVLTGARTQLGHVSFFNLVISHFGVLSLSLAAAVPFYLLFEAPMTSLTKVLLQDLTEVKQKKIN